MTGELRSPCHVVWPKNRRGRQRREQEAEARGMQAQTQGHAGTPEAAGGRKALQSSGASEPRPHADLRPSGPGKRVPGPSQPGCGHPQHGPGHSLRSLGTGLRASLLHLHRPCAGAGASMGPSPPVSPGPWGRPAPCPGVAGSSRGSTEMSREEQTGCCPHHRRPPCESSLSGPALTPCPRPLASTFPDAVACGIQHLLGCPGHKPSEPGHPCGFSRAAQ